MRDLDHVFDAWPLDGEAEAVRQRVGEIAAEVDRAYDYLAATVGEELHPDLGALYAGLFEPGWWGRRFRLRRLLRGLVWTPLAFAPGREVLVMALLAARGSETFLRRIERARRRGDGVAVATFVAQCRAHEEMLIERARREMLARTSPASALACPRCGAHVVADDVYLARIRMLGCRLCAHAESAELDSPDLPLLLRRWGG